MTRQVGPSNISQPPSPRRRRQALTGAALAYAMILIATATRSRNDNGSTRRSAASYAATSPGHRPRS